MDTEIESVLTLSHLNYEHLIFKTKKNLCIVVHYLLKTYLN